jgi:hypothetical protein
LFHTSVQSCFVLAYALACVLRCYPPACVHLNRAAPGVDSSISRRRVPSPPPIPSIPYSCRTKPIHCHIGYLPLPATCGSAVQTALARTIVRQPISERRARRIIMTRAAIHQLPTGGMFRTMSDGPATMVDENSSQWAQRQQGVHNRPLRMHQDSSQVGFVWFCIDHMSL